MANGVFGMIEFKSTKSDLRALKTKKYFGLGGGAKGFTDKDGKKVEVPDRLRAMETNIEDGNKEATINMEVAGGGGSKAQKGFEAVAEDLGDDVTFRTPCPGEEEGGEFKETFSSTGYKYGDTEPADYHFSTALARELGLEEGSEEYEFVFDNCYYERSDLEAVADHIHMKSSDVIIAAKKILDRMRKREEDFSSTSSLEILRDRAMNEDYEEPFDPDVRELSKDFIRRGEEE